MTVDRLPDDASWLFENNLQDLLAALTRDGMVARVVGGAVRDALAHLPVIDIDVATEFDPDKVTGLLEGAGFKVVATGKSHGTVTALRNGKVFQVTTLRVDVRTDGRHADVAFTRDWEGDAARRDFTINAIYADADGTLHDPLGGRADLAAGRVRFIGDADKRVREDYLRVLRYFRFLAAFGTGDTDRACLSACIRGRAGVASLSSERVRTEVLKLLAVDECPAVVQAFAHTGILIDILGGVVWPGALEKFTEIERHLSRRADPLLRMAVVAIRSREDIARIGQRLRLSNNEIARLEGALDEGGRLSPELGEAGWKACLYRLGEDSYRDRVLCNWAGAGARPSEPWRELYDFPDQWAVPVNPFRGEDVVARGVAAGPEVGRILDEVERVWIAAGFPTEEAFVLKLLDRAIADRAVP